MQDKERLVEGILETYSDQAMLLKKDCICIVAWQWRKKHCEVKSKKRADCEKNQKSKHVIYHNRYITKNWKWCLTQLTQFIIIIVIIFIVVIISSFALIKIRNLLRLW